MAHSSAQSVTRPAAKSLKRVARVLHAMLQVIFACLVARCIAHGRTSYLEFLRAVTLGATYVGMVTRTKFFIKVCVLQGQPK